MKLEGYIAICFQHEFDHLNGILFTSKEFPKLLNSTKVYNLPKYDSYIKNDKPCKVYDEENVQVNNK
jgi:hypothetical protein